MSGSYWDKINRRHDPLPTHLLAQEHDKAREHARENGEDFCPGRDRELSLEEERMLERE